MSLQSKLVHVIGDVFHGHFRELAAFTETSLVSMRSHWTREIQLSMDLKKNVSVLIFVLILHKIFYRGD